MKSSRELFDSLSAIDSFQRVDPGHLLDLYCGYYQMHRYTLLLISSVEPKSLISSKVIEVTVGRRTTDGKWALSFSLVDNKFKNLFLQFCDDMIMASQVLKDPANGPEFICMRYIGWQEMLSASRGDLLSKSEIKGLIGEMVFLRDVLIPRCGKEMSLQAWMGPKMADQDFVFPDTWYEVKATTSDAEQIRISSIEQLDCAAEGTLVVLALDQTSAIDKQRLTANSLFWELMGSMGTDVLKAAFSNLLLKMGFYPRPEYEEYVYRLNGIRQYRVGRDFPCLRRASVQTSVVNATWFLSLSAIERWLKE